MLAVPMSKLRVAQLGLGPIGIECLRLLSTKPWVEIVGAVDIDPVKIGKEVREVASGPGLHRLSRSPVVGCIKELKRKPDLIFHTTVSRLHEAYEQLAPILRQGINVVSSCEELAFPLLRHPRLAKALDRICVEAGVRVLGTGVNPGFVMDLLPLCLTGVSGTITAIRVEREVNASTRRGPLQRKIGSGLSPVVFRTLLRQGKAGHAGLKESVALIVHGLGAKMGAIHETADAIIAKRSIRTEHVEVRAGQTCGLHQRAETRTSNGVAVSLDLKMYLDAARPHDLIKIEGDPPIQVLIDGGLAGDQATVAALVNCVPRLLRTAPGLRLVTDLSVA